MRCCILTKPQNSKGYKAYELRNASQRSVYFEAPVVDVRESQFAGSAVGPLKRIERAFARYKEVLRSRLAS
jgi:hypothetical protein